MKNKNHIIFLFLILAILLLLFFKLSEPLAPFIGGFILAYLFRPLLASLQKKGFPLALSSASFVFIMYCMIMTLFIFLLPYLKNFLISLTNKLLFHKKDLITAAEPWIKKFPLAQENWPAILNALEFFLDDVFSWLKEGVLNAVHNSWWIAKQVITVLLSPLIAFYIMKDWHKMVCGLSFLVPHRFRPVFNEVFSEIDGTLSKYIRGQVTISLILATYYGLSLGMLGLHSGIVVGTLTGLFTFIPYLGVICGFLTSLFLLFLQNPRPSLTILITIFFTGHVLEGLFLTPGLIGRKIGLHPALILLSVFIAGNIAGLKGILLSYPLTAIAVACWRSGKRYYVHSAFFLEKP